ncbi:hypothetical protein TWF225_008027 [Orbilia oligospora]|nr:hypothetical protein TWF751_006942 [Orbilia oligospora]KAF3177747.1 hypothetical protein TWF225_008027 [Orbilia oligospora]KAF3239848.1 hypothetical protein TWF217_001170 [Orbilia oligospora]KAF3260083.1 hypothetical protein TWF128_003565 [Orbilia oligospora]KAF3280298.1 hypothetical protein TWF132_011857 [Orbilia oligospora]
MTGPTDQIDVEGRILALQRARAFFEEKVYRVGFPDSLQAFSRATSIEVSGDYQIGLAAATTNNPAYNYVHVYCQKSPPDEVTAVTGWEKGDEGFWSFTPAPVRGFTNQPGDFDPIQVFFDVAEDLELEAIVGNCMWTRASALKSSQITQGLVIRTSQGARWALTVGHGFDDTASTSAENAVKFCGLAPPAVPHGPRQECAQCRANKCNSECKNLPLNTRVTVASGLNSIVTFNPEVDSLNWLDFGAYNIPTNNVALQLNTLSVREVILRTGQLHINNPTAYDEIAGPTNGIQGVATDLLDIDYLQYLLELRPTGIFLFKRGKKTGWTFARLLTVTKTQIRAECIGQKTGKGDCGAIWWVVDAFSKTASPVGYHRARSDTVAYVVPYLTALGQLVVADQRFNGYQFQSLDSYTW